MKLSKKHSLLFLIAVANAYASISSSLTPASQACLSVQPLKTDKEEAVPFSPSLEHTTPQASASLEKTVSQERIEDISSEMLSPGDYSYPSPEEKDDVIETLDEPTPLPDDNDTELAAEEEIGEWHNNLEENEAVKDLTEEQQSPSEKLDTTLEESKRDQIVAEEIQYFAAPHSWSSTTSESENRPTSSPSPSYQSIPLTEMFKAPDTEEFQTAMGDALESFGITPEQAQEAMENATEEDIRQGMELAAKIIHDIEMERQLAQQRNTSEKRP